MSLLIVISAILLLNIIIIDITLLYINYNFHLNKYKMTMKFVKDIFRFIDLKKKKKLDGIGTTTEDVITR